MKILITGAGGLLGSTLCPYLQRNGYEVWRHGRTIGADVRADLADFRETESALDQAQPHLIINLAACTNVDECELYPAKAYSANTCPVENLARWIKKNENSCHLVQISTDQVYDGIGPHREDTVSLTNYYAFSKYAGELAAISVEGTVLRTNFVGKSRCTQRQTLSDRLIDAFRRGTPIPLVDDVFFSPLDIAQVPRLVERVIQLRLPGVFNMGCRDGGSKAEFGERLAKRLGLNTTNACHRSVDALNLQAYRPRDMRLDSSLFERVFHTELPTFEQTVTGIAESYRD